MKIYDGEYPWDVRVEKIVRTLLGARHEVVLLCRNRTGRARREILPDGLEIARLPDLPGAASFPFFLSPVWISALRREIARFRPDRILARDLPLAPLAVVLGRRRGIPVIVDLAEPYPDSLRSQWAFERMSPLDFVVRNPRLADLVERFVVRRASRVLLVCPEAAARLESRGLALPHWVEVGNTPDLETFAPRGAPVPELDGFAGGRFLLLFCGLLAGDRGLDTALDALARLRARSPGRFALAIVGDGPMRAALEAQAASLGLEADVRFAGFIAHDRLPDVIRCADAGLLPFHTCPHIDATLANKLFEYMSQGLPVIAADVPPMARVLDAAGTGVRFRSGDAADLARAIEALAADPEPHVRPGVEAVRKTWSWSADAARLLAALEAH